VSQEDEHLWNPRLFIPPEHLAARIRFLQARGFNLVTLAEGLRGAKDGTLPPRSLAIVFDGGYVDFVRLALPVLRAYDVPATVHVAATATQTASLAGLAAGYMIWKSRAFVGPVTTLPGFEGAPLNNEDQRRTIGEAIAAHIDTQTPQYRDRFLDRLATELQFDIHVLRRRRMLQHMDDEDLREVASAGIEVRHKQMRDSEVGHVFRDHAGVTVREFEGWLTAAGVLAFRSSESRSAQRRASFLQNVAWGWLAVGINLLVGILLSPIIIRRLGIEQYGMWVLLFSFLDYMRVLDFGFRAAVVNGCARALARHEWEGVSRTIVNALAYFVVVGLACLLLVVAIRGPILNALDITPALAADASTLVLLIAVTVTVRLILSPLTGALEGLQRFDIANHAYIASLMFRSTASLSVLFAGHGLIEMAWVVLVAQIGESAYTFFRLRQLYPDITFKPSLLQRDALSGLFRYGRYSAVISASNLVVINAPTTILGAFRTAAEVGYFALPFRLLMYSAEGLTRVADVTSSVTAALDETGNKEKVWRLAVLTNRQCFALFVPVALYLTTFGTPLLHLWVTPDLAENSGHLFPIMVLSFAFAMSGQYNAGAILIGQARHAVFAYGTALEAVATILCLLIVVPHYGVIGTAWVVTTIALLIRGLYLAFALCRQNQFPLGYYLWSVYGRGLLTAAPVAALALALPSLGLDGERWTDLVVAAVVIFGSYFAIGFFTVLEPEHRHEVLRRLKLTPASRSAERLV
jgi:O-antigen/teichoic acid export membrane protein